MQSTNNPQALEIMELSQVSQSGITRLQYPVIEEAG
jgi:hypothetical protein